MDELADAGSHPVCRAIQMTWTDVYFSHNPADPELWLNPADWDGLGRPEWIQITASPDWAGGALAGAWRPMPVKQSLGVPAGSVRIFDRKTLRYLPVARPV